MADAEVIKEAVKAAMDEKMAEYWVDREKHYQHHEFIDSLIKWADRVSDTTVKAVITAIVMGILALLVLGFIFYIKMGGKP